VHQRRVRVAGAEFGDREEERTTVKGPAGEFDECCDAGCTRPIPTRDPLKLQRLGWTIVGPMPTQVDHVAHSPEQPHLARGYTEWRYTAATTFICASCSEEKERAEQ
jgi:hypothetical protein